MGCCSSRSLTFNSEGRKTLLSYIDNTKLNSFDCKYIKRLDAQILADYIDKQTYELLSKGWQLQAPYELFSIRGLISKFELKITFLLFSKDTYECKQSLFIEIIGGSKRNLMRFLEWRFQLINNRIPFELSKIQCLDKNEANQFITNGRVVAGSEIMPLYQQLTAGSKFSCSLNLLYI